MSLRRGIGIAVIIVAIGGTAGVVAARPMMSRWVWTQVAGELEKMFDATLAVQSFEVFLFPTVRVEGKGLELRQRGSQSAKPLIAIDSFAVSTSFMRLWHGNLRRVSAEGVVVSIPSDAKATLARSTTAATPAGSLNTRARDLTIDVIVTTGGRLEVAPDEQTGVPLVFGIEFAKLTDFSRQAPSGFDARLMNPRPRGEIVATGKLGPWQASDPRRTPLDGVYSLTRADMSVFRGIGGTLDSTGRFKGTLSNLAVEGSAHMPDFSVETGGHPMPLDTTFTARVDGTNGNTYLDHVEARLGNSNLVASGEIAGVPGGDGKTIKLNVQTKDARLEDLITLVVREQPSPMRGRLKLNAQMVLPAGDDPVVDVLRLDGTFTISQGRFTSDTVQDKVDELSRRGQGQPRDTSIDNVLSEFGGQFSLRRAKLSLPAFRFAVSGAEVRLAGDYALRGEKLGFEGELRLQAKISQTMTGIKSFLLKAIDPFFKQHGAGAVLPIKVGGTVAAPEFGLNLFHGKKTASEPQPVSPHNPSRRRES